LGCIFLGTFIFNNEKEKMKYHGVKKTVSLWSYFNRPEILRTFLNPFYEPNLNVLWPSVAAQSIVSELIIIFFLSLGMMSL
jgi:myotubularin-related protein 9